MRRTSVSILHSLGTADAFLQIDAGEGYPATDELLTEAGSPDTAERVAVVREFWQDKFGRPLPSKGIFTILKRLESCPTRELRGTLTSVSCAGLRKQPPPKCWFMFSRRIKQNERRLYSRDQLIGLPLAERFADLRGAAQIANSLQRKVSSKAQLTIITDIERRCFSTDPASWVPAQINEVASRSGFSAADLALALWEAVVASLVERRRIDGEWCYTLIPEVWPALPTYDSAWMKEAAA